MGTWRLDNRKQPDGTLRDVSKFVSMAATAGPNFTPVHTDTNLPPIDGAGVIENPDTTHNSNNGRNNTQNLVARRVSVPTEIDTRRAAENAGGLASYHTRSLEFWWDGAQMDIVLVAARADMPAYERDFAAAYTNADFEDCPGIVPEWYDYGSYWAKAVGVGLRGKTKKKKKKKNRKENGGSNTSDILHTTPETGVFDVGYRHGHFFAAFDTRSTRDTITQILSVMQLSERAWLQLVFRRQDFADSFQQLSRGMKSKYKEVTETKRQPSTVDVLLSSSSSSSYSSKDNASKLRDHPEKNKDFATHCQGLLANITQKTQDPQVMLSVRGLVESVHEVRLDWSGIGSVAAQGGRSFEHLVSNNYDFAEFAGAQGGGAKKEKKSPAYNAGIRKIGWPKRVRHRGDADNVSAIIAGGLPSGYHHTESKKQHIRVPSTSIRVDGHKRKNCSRLGMFEERWLPTPSALGGRVSGYVSKSLWGFGPGYPIRKSPPFVIMTLPELGLLLRLPDIVATPNLAITRQQILPQQPQAAKLGMCLGFFKHADSKRCAEAMIPVVQPLRAPAGTVNNNNNNNNDLLQPLPPTLSEPHVPPIDPMFGLIDTSAAEAQGVVIAPSDIQTHMYLAGGTKSGKTTLIRCIAKHLEMANIRGTFPNAFIFVDPKGSDSYDFLRQCESESYAQGRVTFLDPIETKFSINVLELPAYKNAEDRQVVVSQYVGYIMQMIEYWYHGSDAFVRLKRILDTLLQYVYLNNDKPTFLDVYEIILAMQKDGTEMLVRMFRELGRPESVLQQAIESVAAMDKQAYEPALNRLEKFATDHTLQHMFCVRESTIKFEDLIAPGSYTVIRLSQLSIPQHVITLTKQTLVIKLWFAIQERAQRVKQESERTQVLLALDEFQDLAGLPVIEAMLTQARSYGLGLLLAHQTTTQLDDNLFEVITGNAGTQLVGRVSGRDGGRFADAWDPSYTKELKSQLATQEYHHWTARLIAAGGDTQPLPVQFWPVHVPPQRRTETFVQDFIATQKVKYGSGEVGDAMMSGAAARASKWLLNVPYEPPPRDHWHIMCILREKGVALMRNAINADLGDGTTASDKIGGMLRKMVKKQLLVVEGRKYVLPHAVSARYFQFHPEYIGTAQDIPYTTDKAVSYYLDKRFFLCTAPQTVKKGRLRTDLAAYDYDEAVPISVEVESYAEVVRHPEHVKLNMIKWRDLGFEECHVWSTHPGIADIYEQLTDEQKKGVRLFVLEGYDAAAATGASDTIATVAAKDEQKDKV